jgi:tol-pal system protein YbgF
MLSLPSPSGRSGRMLRLAAALAIGIAAPPLWSAPALAGASTAPVLLVAQDSRDAAQLTMRIQDLEQQVRDLTGQVQGLQFQLTQLQTLIDRMNDDNDFRFKALEGGKGGAPGKNDAASQSGGTTPQLASPQNPGTPTRPRTGTPRATAAVDAGGTDDGLGGSLDPLVGKGRPGAAAGAEQVPLGPTTAQPATPSPGRQASLAPAGGDAAQNPAAVAQYKAGYDAIVKGNYTFAADQFRQFIKQYPTDPQAADATNWLGEALLQQQDYVNAADVLVTGYKTYPDSPRAPDMLLKLGIALAGAQQPDASCKTFGLLAQKFPNTTTAFRTRLKQEMARAKCPA